MSIPVEKKLGYHWSYAAGYEECPEWADPAKSIPKPIKDICGAQIECARYRDVTNSNCGFGVRRVAAGTWVGTDVNIRKGDIGFSDAYIRLFNYITFENVDGVKIDKTAPVITKGYLDKNYKVIKASMHFFVPASAGAAPAPTSNQVYIEDWAETTVYYRALGKISEEITDAEWAEEFTNLSAALQKSNIGFFNYMTLVGAFTDPLSKQQRTEVMLVQA